MLKRIVISLLCVVPVAARPLSGPSQVTVHEWGTFTTVSGEDGQAVPWRPLSGPSDLPCFVAALPDSPKVVAGAAALSAMKATVRMETPVLYFYSPRAEAVDVNVRLPQGLITEWYPRAAVLPAMTPPVLLENSPLDLARMNASIAWQNVQVGPETSPEFPTEPGKSHYYAARDTDAAPVTVGGQPEKFLFYRGMAVFPAPLAVRALPGDRFAVENRSRYDIGHLVLFENRSGRFGYRLASGPRGETTLDGPELTSNFDALRGDLERLLTEEGLYPKEAKAMVATWRDSWFEDGARLFYLLPKAAVDDVLPIDIAPRPAQIARVFVGRAEVFTPDVLDRVERALLSNDLRALDSVGRFLEPITMRLLAKPQPVVERSRVDYALRLIASSHVPETTCRAQALR